MPSKLDFYAQMADHTAKQVTGSFGEWTAFLETMGRLYKYPFHEQLMIFAQKPNATACADYDLWNKQMGRYVRRGTKGIALIDTSGDNPRLKYVFDVSDTGGRENSRRLNLWEYKDEHQDAVTAALENRYGVSGEKGLADQLEQIASKLVTEYWNDNSRDILGILADSFLEEYDDYNVEVAFRNAATVSTTYTLMSRCGLNPADYFEHEDFLSVFDFNTRDTIAVLGSAVSNSSEQILRQIAITVKNYEREASLQNQAERTQSYGEQFELHEERGLLDPESDLERDRDKALGQVRTDEEEIPAGAQTSDETALSYAEIKALCAGDERIKEKMDLDVDVARLKLMKANHQSQQYRLEDNLLRYFPEQIEQSKGFIAGFEADMKTLAEHPHPVDGFAGMTVRGDVLTDKENAGAALVDAFKDVKGLDPVQIGSYRGFQMSLTLEDFGRDYVLTLKGQMTHRVTLGKDPRGNLTRIDNALNGMAERLATVQSKLESLYSQMETAKQELGKPFPQENELRVKSARLAELNIALNIDDKTPLEALADEAPVRTEVAKSAKTSVLQKLHSYDKPGKTEPTKKHKEEVL